MNPASAGEGSISARLRHLTEELRHIQNLLASGEELDPRILTDFRDAVNRVRNAAWALQQYAASKATEKDPSTVLCVVAGERVRVTYQLCKLVHADLEQPEIEFQKGQLLELREATHQLSQRLDDILGK